MEPGQTMQTSWLLTSLTCNLQVRHFRMRMMDVFFLLMLYVTNIYIYSPKVSGRITTVSPHLSCRRQYRECSLSFCFKLMLQSLTLLIITHDRMKAWSNLVKQSGEERMEHAKRKKVNGRRKGMLKGDSMCVVLPCQMPYREACMHHVDIQKPWMFV